MNKKATELVDALETALTCKLHDREVEEQQVENAREALLDALMRDEAQPVTQLCPVAKTDVLVWYNDQWRPTFRLGTDYTGQKTNRLEMECWAGLSLLVGDERPQWWRPMPPPPPSN